MSSKFHFKPNLINFILRNFRYLELILLPTLINFMGSIIYYQKKVFFPNYVVRFQYLYTHQNHNLLFLNLNYPILSHLFLILTKFNLLFDPATTTIVSNYEFLNFKIQFNQSPTFLTINLQYFILVILVNQFPLYFILLPVKITI